MNLLKLVSRLFERGDLLTENSGDPEFEKEKVDFLQAVKLIHCSELQAWNIFPKYQQCDAISYYDYLVGQQRIKQLRRNYSRVVELSDKLALLDTDVLKAYHSFTVDVPASLFRQPAHIDLEKPAYDLTSVSVSEGELQAGKLLVKTRWSKKQVTVTYACPSLMLHATEIASIKRDLLKLNHDEQQALQEIKESRFTQPILFISHRWEHSNHPDPESNQLKKLRVLKDCFVIYDYCSFPQDPLAALEADMLQCILKHMSRLINNVVIIDSEDFINRGWCIYEYIASSLLGAVVCDEIRDPVFVSIRNWVATKAPVSIAVRNSWESQQQNFINDKILESVNEILPLFKASSFSVESDRQIVRRLLLEMLKANLPPKKEHQEYLSEWKTTRWTDDELANAFEHKLEWNKEISLQRPSFDLNVPKTIDEAVKMQYHTPQDSALKQTLF